MAKKARHYWFDALNMDKIELGSGKHKLIDSGVYIPKYKTTVPKELYENE